MAPETVLEFFREVAQTPKIAQGGTDSVYDLPIRTPARHILKLAPDALGKLTSTTSLTPVDFWGTGHASGAGKLAPVLLVAKGVEVQIKEKGIGQPQLHDLFLAQSALPPDLAEWEATTRVLETTADVPEDEYVALLNNMNWLTLLGHSIDDLGHNILISPTSLRWVDNFINKPFDGISCGSLHTAQDLLINVDSPFTDTAFHELPQAMQQRITYAKMVITRKLVEAAQRTFFPTPLTDLDVPAFISVYRTAIVFRQGSSVEGMTKIPLSEMPATLRAALGEMEKRLGLEFPRK